MRKKFLISLIIPALLIPASYGIYAALSLASSTGVAADTTGAVSPIDRFVDNVAFGLGEKLTFDVGYGFINAGTATMEVLELTEYQGRPCYVVLSSANSNKFFSSFYRVEDRVKSIMDARGMFTWLFEKKLSEGSYRAERTYHFDQINHRVISGKDTVEVAAYIQDALSVLYFARTQEMKVGQSIFIDNFTDGKKYPLEVKVHRKETIKVKAGKFDCIVVEPLLLTSGIFKHEGRLTVWLTDDRLRLPVLMKSRVLVGSITAELTDFKLGEILDFGEEE